MLNICGWCTTKFAVGIEHCPQCGNADYYPEGTMAKITRHGGPSQVGTVVAAVVAAAAESEKEEPSRTGEESVPVENPADGTEVQVELAGVEPSSVYETWLLADLRDACRDRGLTTSGNKAELVARLVEDDVAKVEEVAEDEPAF